MVVVTDTQNQTWQVGCLDFMTLYQLKELHMANILLNCGWTYKITIVVYFQILSWYLTRGREENRKILRQNIQFQEFPEPLPLRPKLLYILPGVQNNFVISSCTLQRHYKTFQSGVSKTDADELPDLMHLTSPSPSSTKYFKTDAIESVQFPRF
jgi:hypothetical protein